MVSTSFLIQNFVQSWVDMFECPQLHHCYDDLKVKMLRKRDTAANKVQELIESILFEDAPLQIGHILALKNVRKETII